MTDTDRIEWLEAIARRGQGAAITAALHIAHGSITVAVREAAPGADVVGLASTVRAALDAAINAANGWPRTDPTADPFDPETDPETDPGTDPGTGPQAA